MNDAPTVLFLGTHNAGRSQLGSHLFRHVAGDRAHATSAGTAPADGPSQPVVQVLAELGIDSSNAHPRAVTVEDLATADIVVAMKPRPQLPGPVAAQFVQWEFPDPASWDLDGVRELRDTILCRSKNWWSGSRPHMNDPVTTLEDSTGGREEGIGDN